MSVALVLSFRNTPRLQKGRLATLQPRTAPTRVPAARASSTPAHAGRKLRTVRRVSGATVQTRYGPVQVRVKLRGGHIVSITNLALPFDRSRSQEISQVAGPLLRSEALQVQSARIDVVSGATYTSNGYAQSLQSALDRAQH